MALGRIKFHLSTALLMMIAAGGLIGLNVQKRFWLKNNSANMIFEEAEFRHGFPFTAVALKGVLGRNYNPHFSGEPNDDSSNTYERIKAKEFFIYPRSATGKMIFTGILVDAVFALTILFVVWYAAES